MMLTDEELMAYADGELPPLEAKRIEAAMAADAVLAARVARFRSVRRALRTAYDSVVSEPIPEHLRALLGDVAAHEPETEPVRPAPVVDLAAARAQRQPARFGPPAWAAIAASLVVGLLAGRATLSSSSELVTQNGYAAPTLARVLDTRLASAPENQTAETRIGLTFRTRDGEVCRTFAHDGGAQVTSGLACRDDARWSVRLALTQAAGVDTAYRQASAPAPAVLDAVDATIAGEPLDAEQERTLLEHHWRD